MDQGQITKEEARNHPRRNIVTRALGIEPDVRVDSALLPLIRGDRYLLCSDGLVDEVDDKDIKRILNQHKDAQTAAEALVQAANDNGGRDNITVIVADVHEGDELSQPTEEYDVDALFGDDEITTELPVIEVDADPGHEPSLPNDAEANQSPSVVPTAAFPALCDCHHGHCPHHCEHVNSRCLDSIELHRLLH